MVAVMHGGRDAWWPSATVPGHVPGHALGMRLTPLKSSPQSSDFEYPHSRHALGDAKRMPAQRADRGDVELDNMLPLECSRHRCCDGGNIVTLEAETRRHVPACRHV